MENWLTRVWYGEGRGAILLLPLSVLYAAIMAVRRWSYKTGLLKQHRVAKPVIIVGNLTVGGTGKTPLVVWLAQRLDAQGLKVAIVSRGYGGSGGAPREVSSTKGEWREVGDEPVLLSRRSGCPVFVSADRVAAATAAVESGSDVIVSDDGLQHLRLARDVEIVVIDGARGLGNQRLLPAGPLRESARRLSSVNLVVTNGALSEKRAGRLQSVGMRDALTMSLVPTRVLPIRALDAPPSIAPRVDGAVLGQGFGTQRSPDSRSDGAKSAQAVGMQRPSTPQTGETASAQAFNAPRLTGSLVEPAHGAADIAQPLGNFAGRRVHAVAGIGNPGRFFSMLRSHGIEVIEHAFPDHHPFAPNELVFDDDLPILMTEKDAVRAAGFANDNMYFVPVDATFSEADTQRLLIALEHALHASQETTG